MQIVRLKPYLPATRKMTFDEKAMVDIETQILKDPEAHGKIPGLGEVRKMRFARPGMGKRGGGRVIYYVVRKRSLLAMLAAYPKSQREDLTNDDRKAILRAIESLVTEHDP